MIYKYLANFQSVLPVEGRLLGLDIGESKIGIALSDTTRLIATPHSTLGRENISKDTGRLRTILKEHAVCGLVVGLPRQMDGSEGSLCTMVRDFTEKLLKKHTLPVYFQDERMSTAAVSRALQETDYTRKKRDTLDDKSAAAYILQSTLDAMRYQKENY